MADETLLTHITQQHEKTLEGLELVQSQHTARINSSEEMCENQLQSDSVSNICSYFNACP